MTSNIPILEVIIFSGLTGGDELKKLGGQEFFVGGGRPQTRVASMEAWWSVDEVGSSGGIIVAVLDSLAAGGRRGRTIS